MGAMNQVGVGGDEWSCLELFAVKNLRLFVHILVCPTHQHSRNQLGNLRSRDVDVETGRDDLYCGKRSSQPTKV